MTGRLPSMPVRMSTGHILVPIERYEQQQQDIADMQAACQTMFYRCACGRMRERNIICPTNQEGGHCEAGA